MNLNLRLLLYIVVILISFQNCSDYKLMPQDSPSLPLEVETKFCLKPPESKTKWSKVVFVVDVSGSNVTGSSTLGTPPTDPDKSRRLTAIQTFVNKYRNEQYYKWSMILFSNDSAIPLVIDGSQSPIFSDVNNLDAAIADFSTRSDGGGTPYLAALSTVDSLIVKDMQDKPEEISTYNIFFLSDGRPSPGSNDGCDTAECDQITLAVNTIKARDTSSIFLSTVYYYGTAIDAPAALGLQKMAQIGGGTYSNAGIGQPIVFNEVKVGERPESWAIKGSKLIAYNLNSGFCTDGTIDADSDADGLCDKDEILYNTLYKEALDSRWGGRQFDPQDRNSLDDKYSDAFVWKFDLTANSSGLLECPTVEDDKDFDLLNTCEELMLKDLSNANGPTSQWTDYMVNKKGGAADPNNFDSDGDLFLDFMEFFQFRLESGISPSVDYLSRETVYPGGITAEQMMLEHRHFMNSANFTKDNYNIRTLPLGIDETTGQQCYEFDLEPLAIYNTKEVSRRDVSFLSDLKHADGENQILVYFIASPEDQRHGRGALYRSIQTLKFGVDEGRKINFKIEDFEIYKVPPVIISQ